MKPRKLWYTLAPLAALAGLALWGRSPVAPARPPAERQPARTAPLLAGTASCSARGCHGAPAPRPGQAADAAVQLDEFTKWLAEDPHTQAFAVLGGKRSQEIARRLGLGDARTAVRCLACHTTPLAAAAGGPGAEVARQEHQFGVGCESCHGAAGRWLAEHTRESWDRLNSKEKADLGMVRVGDAINRTWACAGCHVGAPPGPKAAGLARDVSHDLIAAGHPRLAFEPAAFLANLPPHWNTEARLAKKDAARDWALGQLACALAALDLLAWRAQAATKDPGNHPWPEFAEYDCYACHHDLQAPSWRQGMEHYHGRMPGSLPWGDWYFSMPRLLAGARNDFVAVKRFEKLARLMGQPLPNRQQVLAQIEAVGGALEKMDGDPSALRRLLREGAPAGVQSWDTAEQLIQAAWSLTTAPKDEKAATALRRLARKATGAPPPWARAFPEGFDSPRYFRPEDFRRELSAALRLLAE
jgi:hypothetical protein